MKRKLDVYLHRHLVGDLVQDAHGQITFDYAETWLKDPAAIALSHSLPLTKEHFTKNECRGFFAGVLPEESKREIVAKNLGVSARNDYAMLEKTGGEYLSAKITVKHFEQLAQEAGLAKPMVKRRVPEMAELILSKLPAVTTGHPVVAAVAKLIRGSCDRTIKKFVIVYRLRTFYAGRRMSIGMEANPVPSSACPGCIESARRIVALEAQVAHLNASIERLRREGKRQAAPFSKGSPQRDPKKPGRKRGENHGEHHRREAPPRIDAVHEAELPGSCPHCRGEVMETSVERQYQTEIPRRVIYRQFNVHVGKCRGCDRRVQGRHPLQTSDALGAAASQIGPDAQALAVHLNKDAGLSHGKVKRLFEAAFDLKISRGASCRTMLRASRRCRPVYQAIVRQVRRSPSIVPDETGWRIGGTPAWLHVAVGADATAYLVDRRRGYEASVLLIGEDYEGTMTHDGWSPYLHFIYAVHQTCLAHLLRRASELEEKAVGGAVHFPRRVKAILQSALTVRDRRDAGEITASQAIEQAAILSGHMDQLTGPAKTHVDNERFAKHLRNQQQTLFPFLQFQGIDATNHKAEQAIRPATVNRKVWGGNRTEAGAEAQSVLMSVLRTATQRGTDAVTFISDTLKATLGHRPRIFTASG